MPIVYVLSSPTGRRYIGQTVRSLDERWLDHIRQSNYAATQRPICRAIRKHGALTFTRSVLVEVNEGQRELNFAETFAIALFRSLDELSGYNVSDGGGRGAGYTLTEETKSRIGFANKGRRPSEATISACIKAHLGKKQSAYTRTLRSLSNTEFYNTIEGREVQRQNAMRRWHPNALH